MKLVHLTPGTGHFFCGSCLRDNTLCKTLQSMGHDVLLVPLYLPFSLEEGPPRNDRVFLGGINMYLQHKSALFRHLPRWSTRPLDDPGLLRWVATKGNMTDPTGLGDLTLATLRGDQGPQRKEFESLLEWLEEQSEGSVLCVSNAMLLGMAPLLKQKLKRPLLCSLQGEAPFLDSLPSPYREQAWELLAEKAREVDAFVAVSRHYGQLMQQRLGFPEERLHVVYNGIETQDLRAEPVQHSPPVLGYLARMCPDKGLHTLVDAFMHLKQHGHPQLRLKVAGVLLDADRPYVEGLKQRLDSQGFLEDAEFLPNVDREQKARVLQSLSVLSVPATYGESFGLYILEALAAGVPVVQPRHGAFPEVLQQTGGGLLCEADDHQSLATEVQRLLQDEAGRVALAREGQRRVEERFTARRMAEEFEKICSMLI